ncbi:hypothetical protein C477_00420 [Haloterrigena salina JCM 13891]|uniref:Uncharacterized protein n=1 Tax=Haloterrigena salina JCM 13891 TaxID=1227488 RepID=M0CPT2_9EURY|nr:hypothetical protein C477_00420 [Haloterrigena salina JCM 13891]
MLKAGLYILCFESASNRAFDSVGNDAVTGGPGSYVSEWIDATVLPAEEHADHGHDHKPDDTISTFQMVLQFGAVATMVVRTLSTAIEWAQIPRRND